MKTLLMFIFYFCAILSLKAQVFQNGMPLLQVNEITYKCKWITNSLFVENQQNNIQESQMYRGQTTNQGAIEDGYNHCASGIYRLSNQSREIISNIVRTKFTDIRALEIKSNDEGGFILTYYTDLSGKIKAVYFLVKSTTVIKPQELYTIEKNLIDIQVPVNFEGCNWVSGSYLIGQVMVRLRDGY